ncbi:MAG: class I SAM-dependent methyltransferase [Bacteroidia bacterium]|nr:class I SAM-dependent methyltransferase [Bacteroidia bacterium]
MDIKEHYRELFKKHGASPHAVQYSDRKSQYRRFEILCEIDKNITSVTDFGCGLADLFVYLRESKNFQGKYLGLDFVPEFIDYNKKHFAQYANASFLQFDINKDTLNIKNDYVILSGVFNNKSDNNEEFMFSTIKKMYDACLKGVAFNAMSTYVDYFDENLFYIDPLKVFDFCKKNITSKVTLRHDYLVKENSIPFEFCIYLYR